MTSNTLRPRPARHFRRTRGVVAALAVVGFFGTAIIMPMTAAKPALADEAFYERIHQEFVPGDTSPIEIPLGVSPAEELPPPPPPKPVVTSSSGGSSSNSSGGGAVLRYSGGGSPAEWMSAAGISESDWGYVDYIATRESGWNPNATNPSSGACGLIQAHPCGKVPGSGYNPVDNLRWANGYAVGRYGSWAQAYEFWINNHWW